MGTVHRASRRVVGLAALLMLAPAASRADVTTLEIVDELDQDLYFATMWDELYTHPGDDRRWGPEHDLARDNIFGRFASYGLDTFLHPFEYSSEVYHNVVAVQEGVVAPEKIYIIGAHFDSVGNPGADDDASGVAALLEIARVLSQYEFEHTITYIAFDREEQGLVGSTAYAQEHADDEILGMLAMDMIAYNHDDGNAVLFRGRDASLPLKTALGEAVDAYGQGLSWRDVGRQDVSNHAPFEEVGFLAAQIREELGNPFWHSEHDHIEVPNYIDFEFGIKVTRSACGWLVDAAGLMQPCASDLDGSGTVDTADLLALLAAWGPCGECPEDLDDSGAVDTADLLILLAAWGPCP